MVGPKWALLVDRQIHGEAIKACRSNPSLLSTTFGQISPVFPYPWRRFQRLSDFDLPVFASHHVRSWADSLFLPVVSSFEK